jgi:hypothetical protein
LKDGVDLRVKREPGKGDAFQERSAKGEPERLQESLREQKKPPI